MDRKKFFTGIRSGPFPGKLTASQVAGVDAILNAWEASGLSDLRWLAYMLGTTKWETDHTMQPIVEKGPRSYFNKYEPGTKIGRNLGNTQAGDGFRFRGRGYVQLTGRTNYTKMGKLLGTDLVGNPDLALDPKVAAQIMFEGMTTGKSFHGDFTGKSLENYFNSKTTDWVNARRIINGTDRAQEIAAIAKQFYADIVAA